MRGRVFPLTGLSIEGTSLGHRRMPPAFLFFSFVELTHPLQEMTNYGLNKL